LIYADDNRGEVANGFDWCPGNLNYTGSPDNTNTALLMAGLLGPYLRSPGVYKCPADRSCSGPAPNGLENGTVGPPRVRSISMSQMFRTWPEGHSPAPPAEGGMWRIYGKTSDMVNPAPCNLWVTIDENPDSINDAAFAVKMDLLGWQDGPGT